MAAGAAACGLAFNDYERRRGRTAEAFSFSSLLGDSSKVPPQELSKASSAGDEKTCVARQDGSGPLYELGRVLGEGAFAVVKMATRRALRRC